MKHHLLRPLHALLVVALLAGLVTGSWLPAPAPLSPRPFTAPSAPSLDTLLELADLVVVATVGAEMGVRVPQNDPILTHTTYRLDIETVLRDDGTIARGEPIVLAESGDAALIRALGEGSVFDYTLSHVGERSLFLLSSNVGTVGADPDAPTWSPTYGSWGRLTINGDQLLRSNPEATPLQFGDEEPMTLAQLVRAVRAAEWAAGRSEIVVPSLLQPGASAANVEPVALYGQTWILVAAADAQGAPVAREEWVSLVVEPEAVEIVTMGCGTQYFEPTWIAGRRLVLTSMSDGTQGCPATMQPAMSELMALLKRTTHYSTWGPLLELSGDGALLRFLAEEHGVTVDTIGMSSNAPAAADAPPLAELAADVPLVVIGTVGPVASYYRGCSDMDVEACGGTESPFRTELWLQVEELLRTDGSVAAGDMLRLLENTLATPAHRGLTGLVGGPVPYTGDRYIWFLVPSEGKLWEVAHASFGFLALEGDELRSPYGMRAPLTDAGGTPLTLDDLRGALAASHPPGSASSAAELPAPVSPLAAPVSPLAAPASPLATPSAPAGGSGAAPRLGVVVDAAMQVISIDAGGPAAAAGLQPGDMLSYIDGISFHLEPDAVRAHLATLAAPYTVQVVLLRQSAPNGMVATLDLTIRPNYTPVPTPTAVPPGGGLLYF